MLLRLLKNLFNIFVDEDEEYTQMKIREYHDLFYNYGKYPLNKRQCEAVVKNKRYNQVIAAAGTGKTTVLSYRIKYLIEEGIAPDRIIAITYSKKAANEMENRLKGHFKINNVEVRTIHSLAFKIIRNEINKKITVISPGETKKIIKKEIERLISTDSTFRYYFSRFSKFDQEYLAEELSGDNTGYMLKMTVEEDNILDYFIKFIDLAKKNNLNVDEIRTLLSKSNKRQYYFGLCAEILYGNFQKYLDKNKKVDFNDMLYWAVDILKKDGKKYYQDYDHMLVDEFQDLSLAQIEFIKQYFLPESKMKLFCVGDDWQSIYSFQGAEPKYFMKFESFFGPAARTYLSDNYRCPVTIIKAGNHLISQNKGQISKKVKAMNQSNKKPVLHILKNGPWYEDYLIRYTLTLVKKLLRNGCVPGEIMILCRYDAAVPYLEKIKKILREEEIPYIGKADDYYNPKNELCEPDNGVSVFSIHQSKGKEAENVILLHVVANDLYSFPEPERENELLEPVKINKVDHLQEERRLFYVAITRCSKNLHIFTQENNLSLFIEEIEPYLLKNFVHNITEIDDYVNFTAMVEKVWKEHNIKIKQVGLLRDREDNVVKFLSWKNTKAPILKENTCYEFHKVKVSKYNNKRELVLTDITEVIEKSP